MDTYANLFQPFIIKQATSNKLSPISSAGDDFRRKHEQATRGLFGGVILESFRGL